MKIAIIVSEFNYDITMQMLELAKEHAEFLELDVSQVVKVPGVYDMPTVLKQVFERADIDGAVVLGAVIEGDTEHDEIVMNNASRKIMDLSVEYGKPVGLGITGPGMTRLQAESRIDRAKSAVEAVFKSRKAIRNIEE